MSTFLPFGCGRSETKNAAKVVPDLPVFFERESKIPLAAFYLFEVPILIGIHKAILEYSFSKNFKKQKSRNRMNYLQAHYCTAFAHSVPAYITYCYGIALTNRY